MTRTIVANLFAESVWARHAAVLRKSAGVASPSPLDPRFLPSDDVVGHVAPLATLLRAFATDSAEPDVLWTPAPVAPERMPDVPGVPRPLLLSGPRPTPGPSDLAWAASDDVACAVNDRRFAFEVRAANGWALPGSGVVDDAGRVDDAVAAAAAASPDGRWIAKAVHSAAGRGRVGGKGPALDAPRRNGIEKLLFVHGAVVVEPWLPRVADFSATGEATGSGAGGVQVQTLLSSKRGDFRGIAFPATGLGAGEESRLRAAAGASAAALVSRGYRGPFGVDAFRWRDPAGGAHFHPLCEINARLTFGIVARALANRIAAATGLDPAGPWTFRVGDEAEFVAARAAPGARVFELLLPGPPDGVAAWMTAGAPTPSPAGPGAA
jgi:hypothetical protein